MTRGVYEGDEWKTDFGKTGGGHIIALEKQKGIDRMKKPAETACPIVIDEERYASGFNPFYPEELPVENVNYMERLDNESNQGDAWIGTCMSVTESSVGYADEDECDPEIRSKCGAECFLH